MQPSGTVAARAPGQSREITAVTRRDIFDFLREDAGPWWGRLDEVNSLEALYDLDALPSSDPRHATAADIIRHRVANLDWDDDWVFSDSRFRLSDGADPVLLDFLAVLPSPLLQILPSPPPDHAAAEKHRKCPMTRLSARWMARAGGPFEWQTTGRWSAVEVGPAGCPGRVKLTTAARPAYGHIRRSPSSWEVSALESRAEKIGGPGEKFSGCGRSRALAAICRAEPTPRPPECAARLLVPGGS